VSKHLDYAPFFKLLKVGLPLSIVAGKMTAAGVDMFTYRRVLLIVFIRASAQIAFRRFKAVKLWKQLLTFSSDHIRIRCSLMSSSLKQMHSLYRKCLCLSDLTMYTN
jgi:hypothetical protein